MYMRAPSIETQTIELPTKTKEFFEQTGTLLPPYGKHSIQYQDIIGRKPTITPTEAEQLSGYKRVSFTNTSSAETNSINELVTFLHHELQSIPPEGITTFSRSYCINTSTIPIEITTYGRDNKDYSFYAKRPDTNRIIGKYLYNLLTDTTYPFRFNEHLFIEESISGKTTDTLDENELGSNDDYSEGLIRAGVYYELLGLEKDMYHPQNRIVTDGYRTVFFDFNIIFTQKKIHNPFLDSEAHKQLSERYIQDVYTDEIETVRKRLRTHADELTAFEDAVSELYDHTYMPLNRRIKRYYGCDSLKDYLKTKLDCCHEEFVSRA